MSSITKDIAVEMIENWIAENDGQESPIMRVEDRVFIYTKHGVRDMPEPLSDLYKSLNETADARRG